MSHIFIHNMIICIYKGSSRNIFTLKMLLVFSLITIYIYIYIYIYMYIIGSKLKCYKHKECKVSKTQFCES